MKVGIRSQRDDPFHGLRQPWAQTTKRIAPTSGFWQKIAMSSQKRLFCAQPFALRFIAVLVLPLFVLTGCDKPKSDSSGSRPSTLDSRPAISPAIRLHWIGKRRLATESNATNLVSIWNMPESYQLERQTLDKLATAPWRLIVKDTPLSNAPVALLRSLLDDVVQYESHFEFNAPTNRLPEAMFAIKLPADRAAHWQTNLPIILASILGTSPTPNSQLLSAAGSILATNIGEWTVVSVSPSLNSRLSTLDVLNRLSASNHWLHAELDTAWLARSADWQIETNLNLPRCEITVTGDGANVRMTGSATFPSPLDLKLDAWSVPTNLICDPLVSFSAVRGVADGLERHFGWQTQQLGSAPNQVFFWAQTPALWSHFMTYPVEHGTNHVRALGEWVSNEWNPIFQTNRVGLFSWSTNRFGLVWMGVPFFKPVIEPARFGSSDFALIGLFANGNTNRPVPAGLFDEFKRNPGLVYYDWEFSAQQVKSWTQMSQLLRMVFGKAQLSPQGASLPWMREITPLLGNAITVVTLEKPDRLAFKRSSTLGLTSVEIHLLSDWLESLHFPAGLTSQQPARQNRPPAMTNSPAAN